MTRFSVVLAIGMALCSVPANAGWFPRGVGKYGPYTGGHGYSYNVAYSYGFAFSAADTWRRDIFAYPGGISPYRPYGRPISRTVFPHPLTPYIAIPGPDGLPTLIQPSITDGDLPETILMAPPHVPALQPVPEENRVEETRATIKVNVPEDAEVWLEKEKMAQTGSERTFETPVKPGRMQIFSVRAKWREGEREIEQFRVVGVKAGETAKLMFESSGP
jgi:uncharacterized protein (TIGR03000 family)